MIRPLQVSDMPRLQELQAEFQWTFGHDFMDGLVLTDELDQPVMFLGAWSRAEVHMIVDPNWTKGHNRLSEFQQIHRIMELRLERKGVGRVLTWMEGARAFGRQLMRLGWIRSTATSWHRSVHGDQ